MTPITVFPEVLIGIGTIDVMDAIVMTSEFLATSVDLCKHETNSFKGILKLHGMPIIRDMERDEYKHVFPKVNRG